ncbi:hypothetical protein NJT12_19805 [Flavobacterium sp. AC]|uniref:Uncharacterized protein n=1 Tax=Flavobacterium azizsancarii TaxID=2961580 RepID=A0ABT4WIE8_9FLAO|nr:hypothetical protein [Flavobacterium azizsancarii]MDA6071874.1 hypothetical protein [Flavobacterium azizsancarii]
MKLKIIHIINAFLNNRFRSNKAILAFTNIEELRMVLPDLLQGYLSEEEMPNSLLLLSPPPGFGTEIFALDLECARRAVRSSDGIRFVQAANDANLSFPGAVRSFDATLGIEISEVKTPKLYVFMRRVMTEAGLSTYAAKNHYNRERPFVVNKKKTCTPEQEDMVMGQATVDCLYCNPDFQVDLALFREELLEVFGAIVFRKANK